MAPSTEVTELTDKNIKAFIEGLFKVPKTGYQPQVIERALKGVRISSQISDPEARVLHYVNDFFERLESVG